MKHWSTKFERKHHDNFANYMQSILGHASSTVHRRAELCAGKTGWGTFADWFCTNLHKILLATNAYVKRLGAGRLSSLSGVINWNEDSHFDHDSVAIVSASATTEAYDHLSAEQCLYVLTMIFDRKIPDDILLTGFLWDLLIVPLKNGPHTTEK